MATRMFMLSILMDKFCNSTLLECLWEKTYSVHFVLFLQIVLFCVFTAYDFMKIWHRISIDAAKILIVYFLINTHGVSLGGAIAVLATECARPMVLLLLKQAGVHRDNVYVARYWHTHTNSEKCTYLRAQIQEFRDMRRNFQHGVSFDLPSRDRDRARDRPDSTSTGVYDTPGMKRIFSRQNEQPPRSANWRR